MEGADPPSPSPDPCYLPALTKKKKKIKESAHPRWVDSQSANQLLAHWLCHQAWILRKDPLLCCCLCCSRCCICVCVRGSLMKWNARIGLPPGRASPSYNVSQPAALWDRGEAASIKRRASGGPGVIQREGRFFFFNHSSLLWREGIVVTPHIHPFF